MDENIAFAIGQIAEVTGVLTRLARAKDIPEGNREFYKEYLPRMQEMLQEQLLFYCETLRQQIDYLTWYGLRDLIKDQIWRNVWKKNFEEKLDGKGM